MEGQTLIKRIDELVSKGLTFPEVFAVLVSEDKITNTLIEDNNPTQELTTPFC